ncbi:TadE/TadG family type IV pilus assembly protein [Sanguibacter sp. HDW7]|uniref:TadE/TadG family type IV pilus assembly protein n=1 Tax=Sanguibacter sp. HDW7 TaxID=2714931 RepID=UPI00140C82DD|nr:TadE/TadG family type IV pilus assembly protein [Sanguibacter sp. HDW7]QIK83024.1 pilus assembly protein [Sanguibacter sp. HDW7]
MSAAEATGTDATGADDAARDTTRAACGYADDAGSAVAEFVIAGAFVVLLLLSVVQLALALHVRTIAIDAASEGARLGARSGMTLDDASQRAKELLTTNLSVSYAQDVVASTIVRDGVTLVEVRVSAPLPIVALIGPTGTLQVQGHALQEPS